MSSKKSTSEFDRVMARDSQDVADSHGLAQDAAVRAILDTITGYEPQWASFNQRCWAAGAVEAGLLTGKESKEVLEASWNLWSKRHDEE